jgi:CRISPR type III-A-associated protein Csm2
MSARHQAHGRRRHEATSGQAVFDPSRPQHELLDTLAERQADELAQQEKISSSQLRKFFGEVKDLLRRLDSNQDYHQVIEPQFKMLRSKAYYARRPGGQQQITPQFCGFIENAVMKVTSEDHFRLFVAHFEAVVGFMYGKNLVKKG